MNQVFKALSDPTRRQILIMLNDGEMSAGDIAEKFSISAPSISHHLSALKTADLVRVRRAGQQLFYSLNTTVFQDLLNLIMELAPDVKRAPETEND